MKSLHSDLNDLRAFVDERISEKSKEFGSSVEQISISNSFSDSVSRESALIQQNQVAQFKQSSRK